jgi:hypothetical protein
MAVQLAVEEGCGGDEREVSKRLGEVPEVFAARSQLL